MIVSVPPGRSARQAPSKTASAIPHGLVAITARNFVAPQSLDKHRVARRLLVPWSAPMLWFKR
jgi:hypothetical protein